MKSVSVLIPAFNRELYLEEAVRSVMNQTYRAVEILIINDASTDSTGAIADRLAQEDSRIRVIHHTENKLRSGALNTGLDEATGDFVSFLDSDDYYLADKLERQVVFLESHPDIDGVYGDYEATPERKNFPNPIKAIASTDAVLEKIKLRANGSAAQPFGDGYIPSCSPLIRTSVFKTIRFDTNLRNAEDLDMWLQILGAGFTLARLPGSTYVYRYHDAQKSRVPGRVSAAVSVIEQKLNTGAYIK